MGGGGGGEAVGAVGIEVAVDGIDGNVFGTDWAFDHCGGLGKVEEEESSGGVSGEDALMAPRRDVDNVTARLGRMEMDKTLRRLYLLGDEDI